MKSIGWYTINRYTTKKYSYISRPGALASKLYIYVVCSSYGIVITPSSHFISCSNIVRLLNNTLDSLFDMPASDTPSTEHIHSLLYRYGYIHIRYMRSKTLCTSFSIVYMHRVWVKCLSLYIHIEKYVDSLGRKWKSIVRALACSIKKSLNIIPWNYQLRWTTLSCLSPRHFNKSFAMRATRVRIRINTYIIDIHTHRFVRANPFV